MEFSALVSDLISDLIAAAQKKETKQLKKKQKYANAQAQAVFCLILFLNFLYRFVARGGKGFDSLSEIQIQKESH